MIRYDCSYITRYYFTWNEIGKYIFNEVFFTWNEIGKYIFNEVFWMTNSSIRLDDIWQKIRGKGWCSLYFRDLFLFFIYNFRILAKSFYVKYCIKVSECLMLIFQKITFTIIRWWKQKNSPLKKYKKKLYVVYIVAVLLRTILLLQQNEFEKLELKRLNIVVFVWSC